jgi:hypothetical protein
MEPDESVNAPSVIVPTLFPGARLPPPLMVTAPEALPEPASVPLMVGGAAGPTITAPLPVAEDPGELFNESVPAVTVVPPL